MKNVIIVLLFVLAGAGFWYQKIYLPGQEKMAEMQRELAKIKKEEEEEAEKAEKEKLKIAKTEAEDKEEKQEPVPEPPVEEKVVVAETKAPTEEVPEEKTSEYGSRMEERDARLAELRMQLDSKNSEFERKRLELQNRKADYENNYAARRGDAFSALTEARNNLQAMKSKMTSGSIRKSASDLARIMEPYEAAVTQAQASLDAVEKQLEKERAELDKEWNQYFSDKKIMENNYRSAVSKVIDETR